MDLANGKIKTVETVAAIVCVTAILVVWSFIAYWNGNRGAELRRARIHACAGRPDVQHCMKATK